MNAPLRVFSIEVVEAPSIALVVATRSLLGSAGLEKLGDSLPLSSQKNARSQSSPRAQFEKDRWRGQDVMALVEKTSVKPGETLIAKLPKGRGTSIEIVFVDGQFFARNRGSSRRRPAQAFLAHGSVECAVSLSSLDTACRSSRLKYDRRSICRSQDGELNAGSYGRNRGVYGCADRFHFNRFSANPIKT
jgi:hypothetical protein